MKIRLLKPYQLLEKGSVIDCIDSIAIEFLKRGAAEIVADAIVAKRTRGRPKINAGLPK